MNLAVIVTPSETVMIKYVDASLEGQQGMVGGDVEFIYSESEPLVRVVVNEAAALLDMPTNGMGSTLAMMLGCPPNVLRGNVVILGEDAEGGVSDAPLSALEAIPLLFSMAGRVS